MLKISEFSKLSHLTVKALRFYERENEAVTSFGKENDHIKFKKLPEAKVLCIYHKGSYSNIGEAYAFLMKYAEQNGYTVAGLTRECYIDGIWNKESEEDWLTEIQLPIE